MTTLVAKIATDMTDWAFFGEIVHGTVSTFTASTWKVEGAGVDDYNFKGKDLVYGAGPDPRPIDGSIREFSLVRNGSLALDIKGGIQATRLVSFVNADDMAGLQQKWFEGNDSFTGSWDDDHLTGYAGDDLFHLGRGGSDMAEGGEGDDTFQMRATFDSTDRIDGGDGNDTLTLNADYFLVFSADMMTNVETVRVESGRDYVLHLDAANIGSGFTVDGSGLNRGSVETYLYGGGDGYTAIGGDNADILVGGTSADTLIGGGGKDTLRGGYDADTLTGGSGADSFLYFAPDASTSVNYDTITDMNLSGDMIGLDYALNGIDAAVNGGVLTTALFDADLALAVNPFVLGQHNAVLFAPDSGDLAGEVFLVIDKNDVAGYQAGEDFVIRVDGVSDLSQLGMDDFFVA